MDKIDISWDFVCLVIFMIDTHAHLDFPEFGKDREEVISRFFSQGGKAIINVGVDLERSRRSVEIAEKYEGVFASVGLHPEYFAKLSDFFQDSAFPFPDSPPGNSSRLNLFEELKKITKNKKVVAIGETGLDYFSHTGEALTDTQKENQEEGFIAQIKLAQELNLPVIVHCRDAWEDLYEILSQKSKVESRKHNKKFKSENIKFVLHCYSGGKRDTERFLKLPNVHFSFSGNITFPKPVAKAGKFREVIKMIPLDRIMLDSDSPYLAPQKFRGKRNEPINILYIAKKIAEIKGIGEKEVEKKTDENALIFFGIRGN